MEKKEIIVKSIMAIVGFGIFAVYSFYVAVPVSAQLFESVLKTESLGQDKTRFCRMRDNFGTYISFEEYLECQSYMFQIIDEKI